jgi:hypothetical protein
MSSVFTDMLVYKIVEATGVDICQLSEYPEESGLLLIPPCVFSIEGSEMIDGLLVVTLTHILQLGARYLPEYNI